MRVVPSVGCLNHDFSIFVEDIAFIHRIIWLCSMYNNIILIFFLYAFYVIYCIFVFLYTD